MINGNEENIGGSVKYRSEDAFREKRSLVDIIESNQKCVWNRSVKGTGLDKFRDVVNAKHGTKFESYWDLHKWSIDNHDTFWEEVWNYFGVISSVKYNEISKKGKYLHETEWFSSAKMNYAENLLKFRDDVVALLCVDEEGSEERVTYAQMYEEVKLYAAAMRKEGLQQGDRVACYMPNRKEAVIAMLAAVSIGGLWGGPVPYYGSRAASNIINAMGPKFLFTIDRFVDNQQEFNVMENLSEISNNCKSIEKLIIVASKKETYSADISSIRKASFLRDFLEAGKNEDGTVPDLIFEQLSPSVPICINFTSGTTGLPKGLLHASSTLLPLLRDFGLHCNCTREDVILIVCPVGWNIWNLFVGSLSLGCTILLFNGCPYYQTKGLFWEIMSKYKVTYTFMTVSCLDKMEKGGNERGQNINLDHLRLITVGSSPVKLQNIDYMSRNVDEHVFVTCLYGATEVLGAFTGIDFNMSSYSGELQVSALGVDLRCINENGEDVIGKRGELVIGTATPSLPIGIWKDDDQKKIFEVYLSKFPGFWTQHDEAWINPGTKGVVIIGRSDETLNQAGERFGSSEIYHAIHAIEELQDYLCVGQDDIYTGRQRAVLFIRLKEGYFFSENLVNKIRMEVTRDLTYRHVPEIVLEVFDIPYNLNNKKMEKLVRRIIAANTVPEVSNVRNPECLKYYCDIPELQSF